MREAKCVRTSATLKDVGDVSLVIAPPLAACDDVLESFGGDITIASKNLQVNAYIDCVWIVGKFPYTSQAFDRLYLKVNFNTALLPASISLYIAVRKCSTVKQL